jgi:hypothetical protein
VALLKSLTANARDLELVRQHCHVEVLGLVIDTIDKLVHAQQLGPAGLQRILELWLRQGFLMDLMAGHGLAQGSAGVAHGQLHIALIIEETRTLPVEKTMSMPYLFPSSIRLL